MLASIPFSKRWLVRILVVPVCIGMCSLIQSAEPDSTTKRMTGSSPVWMTPEEFRANQQRKELPLPIPAEPVKYEVPVQQEPTSPAPFKVVPGSTSTKMLPSLPAKLPMIEEPVITMPVPVPQPLPQKDNEVPKSYPVLPQAIDKEVPKSYPVPPPPQPTVSNIPEPILLDAVPEEPKLPPSYPVPPPPVQPVTTPMTNLPRQNVWQPFGADGEVRPQPMQQRNYITSQTPFISRPVTNLEPTKPTMSVEPASKPGPTVEGSTHRYLGWSMPRKKEVDSTNRSMARPLGWSMPQPANVTMPQPVPTTAPPTQPQPVPVSKPYRTVSNKSEKQISTAPKSDWNPEPASEPIEPVVNPETSRPFGGAFGGGLWFPNLGLFR